jgi:hypothetical protein
MGSHAYGMREERLVSGGRVWRVCCAGRPIGPPEARREVAWQRAIRLTLLTREERLCTCGMVFTPRWTGQRDCDLCELRSLR